MEDAQFELHLENEDSMQKFAFALASFCKSPCIIFLIGQLGAGKTTFVRNFLRAKGFHQTVKSPTYTLVEHYEIEGETFYHFDFYRIRDTEELELIGIHDYFSQNAICLVEWPEIAINLLPTSDLEITIRAAGPSEQRQIEIKSATPVGKNIVAQLKNKS